DRDFPPFPRATRDGYALLSADLAKIPAELKVVAEIKAGGSTSTASLRSGEVASIMTGAPVPDGADAVVMVEHTSPRRDWVRVNKNVGRGENIVPAGAEAKRREKLLSPGTKISYAEVALAASVGRSRVLIHAKPRVAILSTGDEVVDIDVSPAPNQIRNSNGYSLAAQIKDAGAEPVLLPIAPDQPARLRELITEGLE